MLIGDKDFLLFWENGRAAKDVTKAHQVLTDLLAIVQMPEDLSGRQVETQRLVQAFSTDLQPDHPFWSELADLVQLAFPAKSLVEQTSLARRVHQFRYVISAYQAQWVRQHFPAASDRQSLVLYLQKKKRRRFWSRQFDFDLTESSRLHNKLPKQPLRGFALPVNMKVVMNFHTEFILDSTGRFANEIDPKGSSHNGIINGASFNYANRNDRRHQELDVLPVKPHDPTFRKHIVANQGNPFVSPNLIRRRRQSGWENSYLNKKGRYAKNGQSAKKRVTKLRKDFIKDLNRML